MMFAAPELIVAERIDLLDKIEVAAELQHRMLADRVMRGEEGSEFEACHGFLSGRLLLLIGLLRRLRAGKRQGNRGEPLPKHGCRADLNDLPPSGILPQSFAIAGRLGGTWMAPGRSPGMTRERIIFKRLERDRKMLDAFSVRL